MSPSCVCRGVRTTTERQPSRKRKSKIPKSKLNIANKLTIHSPVGLLGSHRQPLEACKTFESISTYHLPLFLHSSNRPQLTKTIALTSASFLLLMMFRSSENRPYLTRKISYSNQEGQQKRFKMQNKALKTTRSISDCSGPE